MAWCAACQRRAPQQAAPKAVQKTKTLPRAPPPAKKAAPKNYNIDYSKWKDLEDSDDDIVPVKEDRKPDVTPLKETLTRWSGTGLEIMVELKEVCRKSQIESKQELGVHALRGGEDPPQNVKLPPDYKQSVGTLTAKQLAKYTCSNERMLVSLYGDIFDVSSRPDLYGYGVYSWKSGRDITWSVVDGKAKVQSCNRFYDMFKSDEDHIQRFLQLLCNQLVSFEQDFGAPVGKLSEYIQDSSLPRAPMDEVEQCKQQ